MSLTLLWSIIMHFFYYPLSTYPADNGSSKLVRGIFSYNFSAAAESSAKTELHSAFIQKFCSYISLISFDFKSTSGSWVHSIILEISDLPLQFF